MEQSRQINTRTNLAQGKKRVLAALYGIYQALISLKETVLTKEI